MKGGRKFPADRSFPRVCRHHHTYELFFIVLGDLPSFKVMPRHCLRGVKGG